MSTRTQALVLPPRTSRVSWWRRSCHNIVQGAYWVNACCSGCGSAICSGSYCGGACIGRLPAPAIAELRHRRSDPGKGADVVLVGMAADSVASGNAAGR